MTMARPGILLFPTQNAVKTYVDAASTGNSTALASEIINRINADDSIKNNLTTETARAIAAELLEHQRKYC